MKKFLSLIITLALLCCLLSGCQVHTENGTTRVTIDFNWSEIGDAIGHFVDELTSIAKEQMDKATAPTDPTDPSEDPTPTTPSADIPDIPEGSDFQVHYIDVGQSDSILIICDGEYILIDAGENDSEDTVIHYLNNLNIDEIDLVVATHAHSDHIGEMDDVLHAVPAVEVWYPDYRHGTKTESNFLAAVNDCGATLRQPDPGTTYTLGSAICQVLGPVTLDVEDPNDTSIVVKIIYGETSFLFTGDAELAEETSILDAGYDISCDVLKVGHHGAYTSTGYRWLKAAAPAYAVISVGTGNSYGHPTEGTLSRLRDAEVTVYRTDMQGHIVCVSDGTNITFSVQKNPDANTLPIP